MGQQEAPYTKAQQRAVERQGQVEERRLTSVANERASAKPLAVQRDTTDLAALSRSKPLAARRTVSNQGSLAKGR